ncbi:MAG: TSUP family transporter, partial [Pseudomonadota bacterium]
MEFITNPWFYVLAFPAVLIVGFSKAGVGGGLGIMAVPMMALVVPPVQAAGVLMPLLLFMDIFTLRAYWGVFDRRNLAIMLPGSLGGVVI